VKIVGWIGRLIDQYQSVSAFVKEDGRMRRFVLAFSISAGAFPVIPDNPLI